MAALHAVIAGMACCAAGHVSLVRTLCAVVGPATPPAGVGGDVGIYFVSLARVICDFVAERTGLAGLLIGLLAQACGVDLRLLGVSARTGSLGLTFTGIDFLGFRFPADFCCLFAVFLLAFLLDGLAALPAHQQDNNQ